MVQQADKAFARNLLMKSYKELSNDPLMSDHSFGLVDDDPFHWQIVLQGPSKTLYDGGYFKALLDFPDNYPLMPPVFKFVTPLWHPNIYPDGKVCISILHTPGTD